MEEMKAGNGAQGKRVNGLTGLRGSGFNSHTRKLAHRLTAGCFWASIFFLFSVTSLLTSDTVFAMAKKSPNPEKETAKDLQGEAQVQESAMRAEYDKINAMKMKRYDELMGEITELRDKLQELLLNEQKLSGEKEKAKIDIEEFVKSAETAEANVKKALAEASQRDEEMRSFAADVAKESTSRKAKIEKLKRVLQKLSDKTEELRSLKEKAEAANAARDAEYKDVSSKLLELKAQGPAGESEAARLKTLLQELEAKASAGERVSQQLSEESLASGEKIRATEEQISNLESEDVSRAKELKTKIENFDKAKNEDGKKTETVEGLKKIAEEANMKAENGKVAIKKIEEDLLQASQEKTQAEKDLLTKMDDLKVRISVLVSQNERKNELFPKTGATGEKDIKANLKIAEKELVAVRREAEQAVLANKELKRKFDKEILEKHFNLAVVYEMNGLYQDSEREYLECLKIDPKDADVHYNLAILYDDRLNDNKKAQEHYYKFLSYRPVGESGERVRDWITRAELEERLGSTVR